MHHTSSGKDTQPSPVISFSFLIVRGFVFLSSGGFFLPKGLHRMIHSSFRKQNVTLSFRGRIDESTKSRKALQGIPYVDDDRTHHRDDDVKWTCDMHSFWTTCDPCYCCWTGWSGTSAFSLPHQTERDNRISAGQSETRGWRPEIRGAREETSEQTALHASHMSDWEATFASHIKQQA